MQVTLYNFTKKINSTKQPTGGTTYEGVLRNSDPVSMFAPRVRFSGFNSAPNFNYAYIPSFGNRFFWVRDWTHDEGIWTAMMEVDVLSTYRSQIGDQDLYVLRSSAEFDGRIIDTKFPAKNSTQVVMVTPHTYTVTTDRFPEPRTAANLFNRRIDQGSFILGIYGPDVSGTAITWYCLPYDGFRALSQALYDWDITSDSLWETATVELPQAYSKAIADPLQFIASVTWVPLSWTEIIPTADDNFTIRPGMGYYQCPARVKGFPIDILRDAPSIKTEFTLPKHPQASRGGYLHYSPYTKLRLTFPPFGEHEIESGVLASEDTLDLTLKIDLATGISRLYLSGGQIYLGYLEAKAGVPMSISQATIDARGLVSGVTQVASGVGTAISAVGNLKLPSLVSMPLPGGGSLPSSFSGGNIASTIGGIVSGAAEAVGGFATATEAIQPNITNKGSNGSFIDWCFGRYPVLRAEFDLLVDDDNSNLGRPLCKVRKPANLGGFMICAGAHIASLGTAEEALEIAQFLTGGFFYE